MNSHTTRCFDAMRHADTQQLRDSYILEDLFNINELQLVYTDLDRAIVGSAVPTDTPLTLKAGDQLRSDYFCQRRELGVINFGNKGSITVDGTSYPLEKLECLYVGKGSQTISFQSENGEAPAQFYLLSYPAHTSYPTAHAKIEDANKLELGSPEESNERHLYQYIHENGLQSCQLVMGFTVLQSGSVWNTMPPHTHDRRSEVYCYFDIAENHQVAHFMGKPQETRVLWMQEKHAVLSPSWSIHSGAGTGSYSFAWGMGGENQRFDDMDGFAITELR
ncbi:5-dehydro-4-deoxy-D-glucuronate isomerase [Verrucomicrobiaceae bacterium N1E253]|uniref:4-deoxy-L-threo-5-hexosulose-uronate ketol-isomerase n=1 Tax=Oceaniferula marina TaxID=2748318 RepID=A0A851GDG3_9BACT|nr:5-dehydro-4-deoxy-D-glucuronate isomerase [Oceaniferula marina]NWK55593.1 5-dehydro-4-deoxy-D-glucuronate isomerase [Oceaniferula marina]